MANPKPRKTGEVKSSELDFSRRQISVIKETLTLMINDAKYGDNQDFLKNIRKIYDAASKLELQLESNQ